MLLTSLSLVFGLAQSAELATELPVAEQFIVASRIEIVVEHFGPYEGVMSEYEPLVEWAASNDLSVTGLPTAVYYDSPHSDKPESEWKSELRVELNYAGTKPPVLSNPSDKYKIKRCPPRIVVSAIHRGDYETVGTTYMVILGKLGESKLSFSGLVQEVIDVENDSRLVQFILNAPTDYDVSMYCDRGCDPQAVKRWSKEMYGQGVMVLPVMRKDLRGEVQPKNLIYASENQSRLPRS
ncbi:MAG: hypothetical protein H8E25_09765 [Planctomycetes bacterium]|nr:hypothetical protein [Planctomycetota bacterium]